MEVSERRAGKRPYASESGIPGATADPPTTEPKRVRIDNLDTTDANADSPYPTLRQIQGADQPESHSPHILQRFLSWLGLTRPHS